MSVYCANTVSKEQKGHLDPAELVKQMIMINYPGSGNQTQVPARLVNALECGPLSPVPHIEILKEHKIVIAIIVFLWSH